MTFDAMFFALGVILFPLLSAIAKIIYVFSTGKKWMSQGDIEFEKARIRNSSVLRNKNLRTKELESQCLQYRQDLKHLTVAFSKYEEETVSLTNENISLKEQNSKLKLGLEKLLERLDNAEQKLGK